MTRKYTPEILAQAAANSTSVAAVLRHLGLAPTGGAHAHISRMLKRHGIDTSHFTGQGWLKGRRLPPKHPPEHYLRVHPTDSGRVNCKRLRRALVEVGRPYRCEGCDNVGEWQGAPLTLHVDHIDGDYRDCRAQNLRFLCPNCHAQTATYAGRNKNRGR
jgi:hypothetical protein